MPRYHGKFLFAGRYGRLTNYVMGLRKQIGLLAYSIRKLIIFLLKIWKSESSFNAN